MPHPAYMTIQGTQQGLITAGALGEQSMGNAWRQGHEDQILVQAINHAIMVPGGAREGHRKHKPLIITKAIDKSSPLIYAALSNGEPLTKCTLDFYRNAAVGGEELFYSVEIKEALIVGVEMIIPHCQDLATAHFTQLERVHFAYQVIRWRHKIAGTVAYDEWLGESFVLKLISAQYPLPEERANAYPPDEAQMLVKDAFERGDSIEGLAQLKREQMINFNNEGLDPVSSGEWLLVKDEAYYFDWGQFKKPLRRRKSEQLVMERLRVHQDQQAVRYGQVFYADDTDGMPLANRRYIAVVNGKHLSGYTDAEGVAYIAASSAGEKIEVHFLFKAPTGLIEDFMEHADD